MAELAAASAEAASAVSSAPGGVASPGRWQQAEDGVVGRRRGWTRSQSPLRQLLISASGNRSISPQRCPRLSQVSQRDDDRETRITSSNRNAMKGEAFTPASASKAEEGVSARGATTTTATTTVVVSDLPSNDGKANAQGSGQQQQQQQQRQSHRVCMKGVLHPVSYDECHIPSDQADNGLSPAGRALVISAVCESSKNDDNNTDDNNTNDNNTDDNDGDDNSNANDHDDNQNNNNYNDNNKNNDDAAAAAAADDVIDDNTDDNNNENNNNNSDSENNNDNSDNKSNTDNGNDNNDNVTS